MYDDMDWLKTLSIQTWSFLSMRQTVMASLFQNTRGWMLAFQMSVGFSLVCSLYADEAQYLYDDQGRLTGVADSAGALAIYNYDAVGNLLSIDRFTPPGSGTGIYLLSPVSGAIGQQVTVQGYGFDPVPSRRGKASAFI